MKASFSRESMMRLSQSFLNIEKSLQVWLVVAFMLLNVVHGYLQSYFAFPWTIYLENKVSLFLCLFVFRYTRLFVGVYGYLTHRSIPVPPSPRYKAKDSTVIIPTVAPCDIEFDETIRSIVSAGISAIIVVTVGEEMFLATRQACAKHAEVLVLMTSVANKRHQLGKGIRHVTTPLVIFADDHVWWPQNFVPTVIAPFEDPAIGGVCMQKRVRRNRSTRLFTRSNMLNFIGCAYLERHNFDLAASHSIDGGVFVISGRTAAYRTSIVQDERFLRIFENEMWLFGLVGPLNADDDNCLTRWLVQHRWKIAYQHGPDALMETVLGENGFRKFNAQCIRWARTTWRSNSTSLFSDRVVWRAQPWSVYAVYISSFNLAAPMDAALFWLGRRAGLVPPAWLVVWILTTKAIKILPLFYRNPMDIVYFPLQVAFGYYHSVLKLFALLTLWNTSWGSRPGIVN